MNLETINKWLDEEYGCSYTKLEELHDFYFEKYCDLKQENKKQKNILDEIYNHCESRINVCKSLQSDDEWECCIAELDGVISILKEVE